MSDSHASFRLASGKRMVLIADDEYFNREILGANLQDHYDLIFAENGQETLDLMREYKDSLSLVMLDLMMPVLSGVEVLHRAKDDPELSQIPIIVITSDQGAEVNSLDLGASDFIPKPYPQTSVILARVRRIIELYEDRRIISETERDAVTNLYNREFFYNYAEQYDHHHKDLPMDAIVVDINHFHMINERFGTSYGDSVLRSIGESLRSVVKELEGIVCRREADTFLVYCPHGVDYDLLLENASLGLSNEGESEDARIWLRMGVYANADKSLDIERRFDRAKMAADTVQGSFTKRVGVYDSTLHERELYSEQLIEDFSTAIKEHQFQVYYQPKFDVQPEIPVLASAEALVRWIHPDLGFISPGDFIPLFEHNGLIQQLDHYVWRQTAAKIKEWKDRFDFAVPVSVNVSRVDMYDPHLINTLVSILDDNGLSTHELLLEITESAYTQDSEQIIQTVNNLRQLGFQVEMDDFGTGYSSLNMISTLPIDALKLDMQFIRNAFNERQDTRMLEVIIDIADYLSVPVIAEGVETEEQLIALKEMGCDYVQGYYFSRPVPAEEYEQFVVERKSLLDEVSLEHKNESKAASRRESAFGDIAHALSSGFEVIFYVDTQSNHYVEFSSHGRHENLQIEDSGVDFFEDAVASIVKSSYDEDRERVELSLKKDALLAQLAGSDPFIITYRMVIAGEPIYYNLKAVRARTHDDHHIVIGMSNIDAQMREIDEDRDRGQVSFSSLARALSSDIESIYYVDVDSGSYLEFKTNSSYRKLQLNVSGFDFFGDCANNIDDVVFVDDRERVAAALSRDALLESLEDGRSLSMTYRLVIEGKQLYYNLKAVLADDAAGNHIIIGVSNVDSQVTEKEKSDARRSSSVTYTSIAQALAADYFSIYYVNTDTDEFIEYSAHEQYIDLGIETFGKDFFNLSRRNIQKVLHPDDSEMFLSTFTKEKVMDELGSDKAFTLTYRLVFDGVPTYVHLKATRMEDRSDPHIVIGVSDIDDQMRREQEYARALRMANQDALTGVKSKHAYAGDERAINEAIIARTQTPFAVAVCDLNDLKHVNDMLGHNAGDQYIKDACRIVCHVFKHSPVYRVGGDEFVAILRGSDYEIRDELMQQLEDCNVPNGTLGAVSIAGGLAVYDPESDVCLADVFGRADAAMYSSKKKMKEIARNA